ncbi:hypothetical protein [Streptomyces sp. NPDC058620]|uniref:hypothetical protein n=1 Tax=Streptomyces sp. NPDC058620 TaxID=3346560 RepID=UPI00364FDC0A
MTRLSERTDRRRSGTRMPSAVGWVVVLLAMVSCCSLSTAAAAPPPGDARLAAPARAMTPTPETTASLVMAHAPDNRGMGSSCHGTSDHSSAVVLPGPPSLAGLPTALAPAPAVPLTGAAAIRGPSNDGVGAVDRLRLQIQRI